MAKRPAKSVEPQTLDQMQKIARGHETRASVITLTLGNDRFKDDPVVQRGYVLEVTDTTIIIANEENLRPYSRSWNLITRVE